MSGLREFPVSGYGCPDSASPLLLGSLANDKGLPCEAEMALHPLFHDTSQLIASAAVGLQLGKRGIAKSKQ